MIATTLRRWWHRDRPAIVVMGIGSLVATLAWRGITRPMVDTVGYRATVISLENGWEYANDRVIGYPLVMMATGAGRHGTSALFFVQLLMHLVAVALVIDVARRSQIGARGRALIAAMLFTPVVLLRVVYEGTEAMAALALTVAFWLLMTPPKRHRLGWALALGTTCGLAALVRPTFALLFVPVMVLAAWVVGENRWRTAAQVAVPALVLIGTFVTISGLRFDSWSLTPNFALNLNSRTSAYVENLPESFEPGRSVLIEERDKALLRGEEMAPQNYIYAARPALEEATGLRDRELEAYIMDVNTELILNNPYHYMAAVQVSALNYVSFDSQAAILGLGRPAAWAQQGFHQLLLLGFVGTLSLIPGLALARRVPRSRLVPLVIGGLLAGYNFAITIMVEAGTARLRAPTEPILALMFVLAISIVRSAVPPRTGEMLT